MNARKTKKQLPAVSERVLILQLKELEADGLVRRVEYPQVPPKVEYSLTPAGRSLENLLFELERWGSQHRDTPVSS